MRILTLVAVLCALNLVAGQVTPQTNYKPVSITVNSAPYDVIATPITPVAPYSQRAYQCNVTGDARFPPYASGTYPLTVAVPVGTKVRVIFANGNLNGATVTQQGEPGVIVQQGGGYIVNQGGGASPIVQSVSSPVVQQNPGYSTVVQSPPTVVQQNPPYQTPAPVPPAPPTPNVPPTPYVPPYVPPNNPTPPPTTTPPPPGPTPPPTTTPSPPGPTPPPTKTPTPSPTKTETPTPSPTKTESPTPSPTSSPTSSPTGTPDKDGHNKQGRRLSEVSSEERITSFTVLKNNRRLLQDNGLVPGGPNGGLVEYVALAAANSVPGFVVPNTQFGVPYVEFTASSAAVGQTASFQGLLEVAQVVGGQPLYPFRPNPSLSPECQVNVNFVVASGSG